MMNVQTLNVETTTNTNNNNPSGSNSPRSQQISNCSFRSCENTNSPNGDSKNSNDMVTPVSDAANGNGGAIENAA